MGRTARGLAALTLGLCVAVPTFFESTPSFAKGDFIGGYSVRAPKRFRVPPDSAAGLGGVLCVDPARAAAGKALPTISAALAKAAPNATIIVAPGIYEESLTIKKAVRLQSGPCSKDIASSWPSADKPTAQLWTPDFSLPVILPPRGEACVTISGDGAVRMTGFQFEARPVGGGACIDHQSGWFAVERSNFYVQDATAVSLNGDRAWVAQNSFYMRGDGAVAIRALGHGINEIRRNLVIGGAVGIEARGSAATPVQIHMNSVTGTSNAGIAVLGGGAYVANNFILDNGGVGLSVGSGGGSTIVNNTIFGNGSAVAASGLNASSFARNLIECNYAAVSSDLTGMGGGNLYRANPFDGDGGFFNSDNHVELCQGQGSLHRPSAGIPSFPPRPF